MAERNIRLPNMTCITVVEDALGGPMYTNVQFMGGIFTIEQCRVIKPAETRVFILGAVGLTAAKTKKYFPLLLKLWEFTDLPNMKNYAPKTCLMQLIGHMN